MVCVREVLGVTGTLLKANSYFKPRGSHDHVDAIVDWCSLDCLRWCNWIEMICRLLMNV